MPFAVAIDEKTHPTTDCQAIVEVARLLAHDIVTLRESPNLPVIGR
jgi:hypothetical protein